MRGLLIALLSLLAFPAAATQDAWPALYDVAGVSNDDVLNIRERPDAASPVIGTLAPDATGVELIRANDRETWALVNSGEGSGWVSLSFMQRQPGQWLGAMPQVAACVGTEPFWNLKAAGQKLEFSGLAYDTQTYTLSQSGPAVGRYDRFSMIANGTSGTALAAISMESCNDGMSDRDFGMSVDLFLQGADQWQHLSGCCSLTP